MPRIEQGFNPATGLSGLANLMAVQQDVLMNAVQARMDTFAATRGYDNLDSMSKYLNAVPPSGASDAEAALIAKFRMEAEFMQGVVSLTWARCYVIMNTVMAGERPAPSLEELLAELPELKWPDEAA